MKLAVTSSWESTPVAAILQSSAKGVILTAASTEEPFPSGALDLLKHQRFCFKNIGRIEAVLGGVEELLLLGVSLYRILISPPTRGCADVGGIVYGYVPNCPQNWMCRLKCRFVSHLYFTLVFHICI